MAQSGSERVLYGVPPAWGLSRYDGEDWVTYTTDDGLPGNDIYALAVDLEGSVWISTWGKVSRFDGETWITWTVEDGLGGEFVWDIAVGSDGTIWLGTESGLSSFAASD